MLNRILVPLDGSAFAERVLPIAVSMAEKANARIHLVHALDLLGRPEYASGVPPQTWWSGGARDRAHAYVLELATRISDHTQLQVTAAVLDPPIVENLIDQAQNADLIVMATRGLGPLRRVWLGSIGDQIARSAPCPVLFLRLENAGAELPDTSRWRHILVPLDGSESAEVILPLAAELARANNARLTLLHAVWPTIPTGIAPMVVGMEPILPPELLQQPGISEEAHLNDLADRLRAAGVHADVQLVVSDYPVNQAILQFVRENDIDMIAMTTHGRGGFERLILGSVSHHLIRHAGCPVLIMRPDPARTPVNDASFASEHVGAGSAS